MIQIALADDHAILRKGVGELLSKFDDMAIVIEAGNGKELLDQMEKAGALPDVCIIDINMPELNGYDTARGIRDKWPDVKILALSMYDTEVNIIKMLRSGANGYVLKDASPDELRRAIQEVHAHGFYHSELVTSRMLRMLHNADKVQGDITDKEMKFMELACSEMTYKEIAEAMELSPRTIDGYRESLFLKLDIKSRTGLAIYAIKAGIVAVK